MTDIPAYDEQKSFLSQPQTARTSVISETVSINVNISTSSGMEISRDGLYYGSLGLFTTNRKCSFHFGIDGGAEMSAVYHRIISMFKLCAKSVWIFFGDDFRCKFLGLDTYKEYVPIINKQQGSTTETNVAGRLDIVRRPDLITKQ